ncbi:MAG: hypothetical protein ACKN85_12860, partial [Pirellula sp.]
MAKRPAAWPNGHSHHSQRHRPWKTLLSITGDRPCACMRFLLAFLSLGHRTLLDRKISSTKSNTYFHFYAQSETSVARQDSPTFADGHRGLLYRV